MRSPQAGLGEQRFHADDVPLLGEHPDELVLTGRAGTAFLFCGHLLHRGTRNRSSEPRPAIQVSWRPAGGVVS